MLFAVIASVEPGREAREALARLRPDQMRIVEEMAASGAMRLGGGLTDADGRPTGSLAIIDVADRAGAEAWVAAHPYRTSGAWGAVEIVRFRPAPAFDRVAK